MSDRVKVVFYTAAYLVIDVTTCENISQLVLLSSYVSFSEPFYASGLDEEKGYYTHGNKKVS